MTDEQLGAVVTSGVVASTSSHRSTSSWAVRRRDPHGVAYADAMTTGDVSAALFDRVRGHFDDDQIVELTEVIVWENASARFNRALRLGSQHLWPGSPPDPPDDP